MTRDRLSPLRPGTPVQIGTRLAVVVRDVCWHASALVHDASRRVVLLMDTGAERTVARGAIVPLQEAAA